MQMARHRGKDLDFQRGEIDRTSLGRKSQRRKASRPKSLDRFGPAVQIGERRQQRSSHRNTHGLPVEGIGAIAREQHGVGAKCHRIAEDVPDLVSVVGRDALSTMDIVAMLTRVVQQQQNKIKELETRLDAMQP